MDHITPDSFLSTVFPPDLLLSDERVCIAYPDSFVSSETGERVDFYRQLNWKPGLTDLQPLTANDFKAMIYLEQKMDIPLNRGKSWYFCVSTVVAQRRRQVKKRLEDVRTAFVLVVDDVGTKSAIPPVEPSYALETSSGNFQYGYLLEPYDVSGVGAAYYDQCLMSLAAAGFNDPGFRSANRLARLPGSVHKSGFVARLDNWRPAHVWDLEDLMTAFGVPLVPVGRRHGIGLARAPGFIDRLADVTDPLSHWLHRNGRVLGHGTDFIFIECPWRSGHTDNAQGPTATGFSPYGYGKYRDRGFRCLHGHCTGYSIRHFEEWARSQGADIDLPGVV